MKSKSAAFAAILTIATAAWAAAPDLTQDQLAQIIHRANGDEHTVRGFIGSSISIDLRPAMPYFYAAGDRHGPLFACQPGFEAFAGGPVKAKLVHYLPGEDGPDFLALTGCTAQER